jgi:hypothetical protein
MTFRVFCVLLVSLPLLARAQNGLPGMGGGVGGNVDGVNIGGIDLSETPEGVAPPVPAIDSLTLRRSTRVRCGDLIVLGSSSGYLKGARDPVDTSRLVLSRDPLFRAPAEDQNYQWLVRGSTASQNRTATHLGCHPGAPMSLGEPFVLEHAATGLRLSHQLSEKSLTHDLRLGTSGAWELGLARPLVLASHPTFSFGASLVFTETPATELFFAAERRPSILRESPLAIRCGAQIRLRHLETGFRLHSHGLNYFHRGTSAQQQVTGFALADDNDLFIVHSGHNLPPCTPGSTFRHGDIIRLTHKNTGRNLHSHAGFLAPASNIPQEVTAFGTAGQGDSNDNWRISLYEQRSDSPSRWLSDHAIALFHVQTGAALRASGARFPIFRPPTRWSRNGWTGIYDIDWQGEVMASPTVDASSAWVVETHLPPNDLPGGFRRSVTLAHGDFFAPGSPALTGDLHALTERGYVTEYAASLKTAIGALARWARDATPGQRRLVHFAAHGTSGVTLEEVLAGTAQNYGDHSLDMTESKVAFAALSPYLDSIAAKVSDLAVFDGSCEGGNTVLAAANAPYCALSTTSFSGPGLFDRPSLRTFVEGFDALGSGEGPFLSRGAGVLQGELLENIGGRIQQRIFRNGCSDNATQMAIRTALMRQNHLGGWRFLALSRTLYEADLQPTPFSGDPNLLGFELRVFLMGYRHEAPAQATAVSLLEHRLTSTTSLERWTFAAKSTRMWDELLGEEGDMMALRSLPPSEWPETRRIAVDPRRYDGDLVTLRADLAKDLALLRRFDAERQSFLENLIEAIDDPVDPRTELPSAVLDATLALVSEYRTLIEGSTVSTDGLPDLARLWRQLGSRRTASVFFEVVRLRWNERAQDALLTRMQPLLGLDEDLRCALENVTRSCEHFDL